MYNCRRHILTIFSFLLVLSATATRNADHRPRRLLHQPFFPADESPPPSPDADISQPPLNAPSPELQTQQPKYPFSALPPPSTTVQLPFFFPFFPSPPPPPPSTVPTFPANISSVVIPSSYGYRRKPIKLISIIVSVSILSALAFASLLLLLRSRRQQLQYSITDGSRLFPQNAVPSDSISAVDASKKPPPSLFPRHTPSSTSSEFLYLGTLVSSRDPNHPPAPVIKASTAAATYISTNYQRLDSPDLQPLPPLPRHYSHHTVNPSDGEESRKKEEEENTFSNGVGNDFTKTRSLNSLAGNSPAYFVTPGDSPSVILNSSSPRSVQSKSPDSLVSFPVPLPRFIPAPPAREPRAFLPFSPSSTDDGGTLDRSSRASDFSGDGKFPTPPPPPPPPPQPLARFWEVNLPTGLPELVPAARKVNEEKGNLRNSGIETVEMIKPKLKPLHWDKVRATSERAMVWDQMKPDCSFQLDEEMIETLFTVNAKDGASQQRTPERKQNNLILDPRKSHNIAILLRALNVTVDEVCEALVEGNTDSLGVELLESLLKIAPIEGEELKLRELKGESHFKRGIPEAFLTAILDIPFAFKRVDAMLYIASFESEVEHLKSSFSTLESACEELKSSRMFLKLLEAVLKTGNRMNVGTNRGDAHAFKLDTLLKFVDVKGADGKTTLLHFVVQDIISAEGARLSGLSQNANAEKSKESSLLDEVDFRKVGLQVVSGLSGELINVKKAAAMDADVLRRDVAKLTAGITKITELLRHNEELQPPLDGMQEKFSKCMNETLKRVKAEIENIQAQEGRALSMMRGLTEYFYGGSGKEESHPLRIFMVVRDFLSILDNVCKNVGKMNDRNMVSLARPMQIPVANSSLPLDFPDKTETQQCNTLDDETSWQ